MLKTYALSLFAGAYLLLAPLAAYAQRLAPTTTVQAAAAPGGGTPPPSYAVPEKTPWSHLIDSLTAPLDKSRFPSGILYDCGSGWFTKA